jgi:hypothetical protein
MTIDRQLESGATRGPLSAEEELDALDDIAREAEDQLYSHLDAYGATKRTAYAIADLVRAIVAVELAREKLR